MEQWLWIIIGILLCIILCLLGKVFYMQKAAREIEEEFAVRLLVETNTLIDISSHDKYMRQLATSINRELKKLRQQRHKFQQGDIELKEAVTNISHDLRTPLTAIYGYLELLEREETSEDVARYLSQIHNRAEVLKQLTEELFRYSVVSSAQELKIVKTELNGILEESLLSFYGAMQQKGITPEIVMPEKRIVCMLDGGSVSRIFSNIISNVLKYSDGDFKVEMDEEGTILFSNQAKGLNSITAGRLFDRFYTVETGTNSTGLGLSIARNLTERMGGEIDATYHDNRLFIHLSFMKDKK